MEQRLRARAEKPHRKIFDWISQPRPAGLKLTPFQQFTVDVDWEKSPLGPMASWPAQLRHMVLLVMADPSPAVVYWDEENTIVYNEPYTQLIGDKHPALQGQDPKVGFAEVWNYFEKLLSQQREDAVTVENENACLLLKRHGFLEETFFTWKFVPIIGEEGWVVGSHATVVEVTREVLTDRRISVIQAVSKQVAEAKTVNDLWAGIIRGVEGAEQDVPMALLYSVADILQAMKSSSPPGASSQEGSSLSPKNRPQSDVSNICILEGSIGIPQGHGFAPSVLDITEGSSVLSPCFRKAMQDMCPVLMTIDDKTEQALEGIQWRGYGIAPSTIVVYPIIPTHSGNVLAFLVLALNPRRPYDDDYQKFSSLLAQQVTTPQLAAVLLRGEVERRLLLSQQDAIDRDRLTHELSESEKKFANFVTRSPIGLAILTAEGLAMSANELWQDLTQLHVGSGKANWENVLVPGELEPVLSAWGSVISQKIPITMQTRIRRPWRADDSDPDAEASFDHTHILLGMHPDLGEDGEVHTVMSVITDISSLKWSEVQLRRRMDQAIEMKNQQERFIDMTSHEMRNPLSALIGCADEIITSLNEYRKAISSKPEVGPTNLLDEAIEAADTIIYCAMHQKRIIDDILTLSRLDSNLLIVAPEPSQPLLLVKSALKMFEAEMKRADTKLEFIEHDSLKALQVNWTLMDSSRVLQVLINLMTNAIKFTRTQKTRHITIIMSASLTKPSESNEFGVEFVQKSKTSADQTFQSEWGNGELLYVSLAVKDTGRGLSEAEIKNLFHHFQQASPKTHVQYGGSGLGLFISRLLVEMQGGEIGVGSTATVGSTFQFYIKTRRTTAPIESPKENDYQLLVREDAVREACAVEISNLEQNGLITPSPPVVDAAMATNMQNLSTPTPPTTPHDPRVFHILVVEDNLVNQKVVSKQLRKSGHVVSVANHGEEALDFIRRSEYWSTLEEGVGETLSVVLMDLEMPVMDGITCVRRIREWETRGLVNAHVPIIAVTANARRDQILKSMGAGMDDVTTKPYRIQDMLLQIEKLVSRHSEPHAQLHSSHHAPGLLRSAGIL